MEFAVHEGLVETDPTIGIRGRLTPKTDGHTPWTVKDIAKFREYWAVDSAPRIAMELFQWTGARVVDVMVMGPAQITDGYLFFTQEKTGFNCTLPLMILPDGMTALQTDLTHFQTSVRHATGHLVWVVTSHGKPRSQKGLSQWFSEKANEAGLATDRTAHGLRKYRDVRLAEAGLSTLQIRSWTGQQDLKTLELYIRDANLRAVLEGPKQERKLSNNTKL